MENLAPRHGRSKALLGQRGLTRGMSTTLLNRRASSRFSWNIKYHEGHDHLPVCVPGIS